MPDIVSPEVRSRMMSGIRGKNTKPEMVIRKQLHSLGFRYLLHDTRKPGKPDMVFPKYNAIILVHGCFWHGHDCHLFKWPGSRKEFWHAKIERNRGKDRENLSGLIDIGWRVMTIWECALKGRERLSIDDIMNSVSGWLCSDARQAEIRGGIAGV